MSFDLIIGHERPIRVLRRALSSQRVPHAYLFWGPDGIGKSRVAREVAKVLLCADAGSFERAQPCDACGGCLKVDAGSHPDLHLVESDRASVSVEDIRALQETLSYRAFERGRRIAILPEAFRMTREASNALLKTLEEPSAGIHIFLLAQHRSQLLPTLVSRCQALRFDPLHEGEVGRLLESRGVDAHTAEALSRISGGCPGAVLGEGADALIALESETAEIWGRWERMGVADRFGLSSRWAAEKERLGVRLTSLERSIRRSSNEAEADGAKGRALEVLDGISRTRRMIQQNVNAQLAIDALFFGLGDRGWDES